MARFSRYLYFRPTHSPYPPSPTYHLTPHLPTSPPPHLPTSPPPHLPTSPPPHLPTSPPPHLPTSPPPHLPASPPTIDHPYITHRIIYILLYWLFVDIIFAYCYNHRTTQGENSVESAWTVGTLSPTLSCLEVSSFSFSFSFFLVSPFVISHISFTPPMLILLICILDFQLFARSSHCVST